jgi:hypothetical protein
MQELNGADLGFRNAIRSPEIEGDCGDLRMVAGRGLKDRVDLLLG